MAHEKRRASMLKKHGLKGVNEPKKTPKHKTKSHVVLAQKGHELKLIRFGQQGVTGAGKSPKTAKDKARKMLDIMPKTPSQINLAQDIGAIKQSGRSLGCQLNLIGH